MLLEYLSDTESLSCENHSEARCYCVIDGMKQMHIAYAQYQDIKPKNILIVPGA
ncbi:hypothetical protein BDV23DRAFT_153680 [Aspergillus alliaceus]|uniref:Protein kinase domain-containing protein n=1 Tax=Petromyces alliaceus TaxID=209559 RepID=A0A5N7CAQ9_PETAA|nr:hypothetical protein BDV23DRAFT_153680 [Aspergillus alliaceus]